MNSTIFSHPSYRLWAHSSEDHELQKHPGIIPFTLHGFVNSRLFAPARFLYRVVSSSLPSLPVLIGLGPLIWILFGCATGKSDLGANRVCFEILLSIFFLPFVKPLRWVTKLTIKISFWPAHSIYSLILRGMKLWYHLLISTKNLVLLNKHYFGLGRLITNWRPEVTGLCIVAVIAHFFPYVKVTGIGSEVASIVYRMMRTYAFLQCYILLVGSLQLLLFLRVDWVMTFFSQPCVTWLIIRAWTVITWSDLILVFSPSACYYLHLSFERRNKEVIKSLA